MGFLDFAGEMLGKIAVQAKEMDGYKREYEGMSNNQLKVEFDAIKNKRGDEYNLRRCAIKSVLSDRGYGQQ